MHCAFGGSLGQESCCPVLGGGGGAGERAGNDTDAEMSQNKHCLGRPRSRFTGNNQNKS